MRIGEGIDSDLETRFEGTAISADMESNRIDLGHINSINIKT